MCNGDRDGQVVVRVATCQVCSTPLAPDRSLRTRYCSPACQQRAFRARHAAPLVAADPTALRQQLQRQRAVRAATLYECGTCGQQQLGQQRCDDCGIFGAAIGLGGTCPHCDEPVLLPDLHS